VSVVSFFATSDLTKAEGARSTNELLRAGGVIGLCVFLIVWLLGDVSGWVALLLGVMVWGLSLALGLLRNRRLARRALASEDPLH
jgi:Flp pilus assembly protein TadB